MNVYCVQRDLNPVMFIFTVENKWKFIKGMLYRRVLYVYNVLDAQGRSQVALTYKSVSQVFRLTRARTFPKPTEFSPFQVTLACTKDSADLVGSD